MPNLDDFLFCLIVSVYFEWCRTAIAARVGRLYFVTRNDQIDFYYWKVSKFSSRRASSQTRKSGCLGFYFVYFFFLHPRVEFIYTVTSFRTKKTPRSWRKRQRRRACAFLLLLLVLYWTLNLAPNENCRFALCGLNYNAKTRVHVILVGLIIYKLLLF